MKTMRTDLALKHIIENIFAPLGLTSNLEVFDHPFELDNRGHRICASNNYFNVCVDTHDTEDFQTELDFDSINHIMVTIKIKDAFSEQFTDRVQYVKYIWMPRVFLSYLKERIKENEGKNVFIMGTNLRYASNVYWYGKPVNVALGIMKDVTAMIESEGFTEDFIAHASRVAREEYLEKLRKILEMSKGVDIPNLTSEIVKEISYVSSLT